MHMFIHKANMILKARAILSILFHSTDVFISDIMSRDSPKIVS